MAELDLTNLLTGRKASVFTSSRVEKYELTLGETLYVPGNTTHYVKLNGISYKLEGYDYSKVYIYNQNGTVTNNAPVHVGTLSFICTYLRITYSATISAPVESIGYFRIEIGDNATMARPYVTKTSFTSNTFSGVSSTTLIYIDASPYTNFGDIYITCYASDTTYHELSCSVDYSIEYLNCQSEPLPNACLVLHHGSDSDFAPNFILKE